MGASRVLRIAGATAVGLCLAAVGLTGCTASGAQRDPTDANSSTAAAPSTASPDATHPVAKATTSPGAGPTASGTPSRRVVYGADSITVLKLTRPKDGEDVTIRLTVRAPRNTRFALGPTQSRSEAQERRQRVQDAQGTTYVLSCVPNGRAKVLFATVSDGGFEYAFSKDLK